MKQEILEILREQEAFRRVESLAGNIVKEEFHKGVQFGIRLAYAILENASQQSDSANKNPCTHPHLVLDEMTGAAACPDCGFCR